MKETDSFHPYNEQNKKTVHIFLKKVYNVIAE